MPTPFYVEQDRALRAIERVRGEVFTVIPQTQPGGDVNARPVADTTRAQFDVTGVFTEPHASSYEDAPGHSSSRSPQSSASKPQVALRKAALPCALQAKDRVVRVGTAARYSIAKTGDDGQGRIVLTLNG